MGFTPYSLYMFNRQGECMQYIEWSRPKKVKNATDDHKMMFGLFFSLNQFVAKMDPTGAGSSQQGLRKVGFHSFRTDTYKLHFFETPTGFKFVLTTDPGAGDLRECLRHIYANLYIELIMKNPAYDAGRPFTSELFVAAVNKYVKSIP